MLFRARVGLTGLFVALFLCLLAVDVCAENKVVAKVGSVPITEFELNQKLQQMIPLASSWHSGISEEKIAELEEEALEVLVERALMVQYAISEEISLGSDAVEKELERLKSQFDSDESFRNALGDLQVSELRAAIYRKLLANQALAVAVEEKVHVSEKDIRSYYEENKHRYMRPRQFRASHILLKVDPSGTKEEKAKRLELAKELVDKARDGEDFYNLAYYNSDDRTKFVGGDMGFFHQGQIMKELEDVILEMKVGEVSDPIETLYGYSVIKLVNDNPPSQMSFEDIKLKLTEAEKKKQYDSLKKSWLDELKSKYKVELTDS